MPARIRPASSADDALVAEIDRRTWSERVSPGACPSEDAAFFVRGRRPEDVLVAEDGGELVGYVLLGPATELPASSHVLMVRGLGVAPAHQGRGIGRALMAAAIEEARRRGARRLTLRVLGPNTPARALYEAMGFETEGILREEFRIGGEYVDDVLMACRL